MPIKKTETRHGIHGDDAPIVFGFKDLKIIDHTKRDAKFFINFLERLKKLSGMTWTQIKSSSRHSYGSEKIPVCSIRPNTTLPAGTEYLLALRNGNDELPFLGYREDNIFQIVFIEYSYGDIYKH